MTLIVALGVYVSTMAPGPLWGDSGDAQLRVLLGRWWDAREMARAHAPYYLSAMALTATGLVSAAKSANLIAAIAGALTIANMGTVIGLLTHSWVARVAGILLLLLSHTLWQMSCGAEVITFSTMCLSAELMCVIALLQTPRLRLLVLVALIHGIGWSTHNLALLTLPAYGVLLATRRDLLRVFRIRDGLAALGAWLLGCSPLIYLVIDSYRANNAFGETLRSLLVGSFSAEVTSLRLTVGMVARVFAYAVLNFPTPLLLLAPWGWWRLRRMGAPGIWLFLTVSGLTHLAFAVRYDVPDQYTFMVHCYLFVCIFIAVGIACLVESLSRRLHGAKDRPQHHADPQHVAPMDAPGDANAPARSNPRWAICMILLSVMSPIGYALLPTITRQVPAVANRLAAQSLPHRDAASWFLQPWRTANYGAETYAREVLASLPESARFVASRTAQRPIEYIRISENLRPDLLIGEQVRSNVTLVGQVDDDAIRALVMDGKFYVASANAKKLPTWLKKDRFQFVAEGLVYRLALRSSDATGQDRATTEPRESPTDRGDMKTTERADSPIGGANLPE